MTKMKEQEVRWKFQSVISNLYTAKTALEVNRPVQAFIANEQALELVRQLRDEFVKP
jgi:hypothetical protein